MRTVSKRFKICISVFLLICLISVAFYPSLGNGFVNWDDDLYVVNNTVIKSAPQEALPEILTGYFLGHYQPLTILSYFIEYHFFKLNPFWYHLTNLLFHIFNSLLVFWFIILVSSSLPAAFMVALLFGIHPMHVESVAWISERKDVLYSFFYLASLISYFYYLRKNKAKYYIILLLLFLASLLSKAMAATLPLALLLIDFFEGRKDRRKAVIEKIPFFLLSAFFVYIAIKSPVVIGEPAGSAYGVWERFIVASYSVVFYLAKLFIPVKLSCLYPYYGLKSIKFAFIYPIFISALFVMTGLSLRYTKKIFFGVVFFVLLLLPVIQLVPQGETIVADRYTYLSSIGIFYIAAEFLRRIYLKRAAGFHFFKISIVILLVAISVIFIYLTRSRCSVFKNGISLWSDVLAKYPDSAVAYNNRGVSYFESGQYDLAHSDFNHVIGQGARYYRRSKKEAFFYYNLNLSDYYNNSGQYGKTIDLLTKAIKEDPDHSYEYYNNLSIAYCLSGRKDKAVLILKELIDKNPYFPKAYYNLGLIYKNTGYVSAGVDLFEKTIQVDPGFSDAYYALGVIYHDAGDFDKAIQCYKKAIESDANRKEYFYNDLASAYLAKGMVYEALGSCRKALKIKQSYVPAHINMGIAFLALGNNSEAQRSFKAAIKFEGGDNPVAEAGLAKSYNNQKSYSLAIKHYKKAVALGYVFDEEFESKMRGPEVNQKR